MRRILLIASGLWVGTAVFASSFASFTGGGGDGYAHVDFITPRLAAAARFSGSRNDGYAHGDFITSRLASVARFSGSSYDGYAQGAFITPKLAAAARFSGSSYDGYASARFNSVVQPGRLNPFHGGSFDGYDRRVAFGFPNWALGDTDANGLPDWWELKYFGVLTGTPAQGDADHEGMSNLAEYLSGTNPTNAVSFFHIISLTLGSPTRVWVACEPDHTYTLFSASQIGSNWTPVTGQVRIPASYEGVLELNNTNISNGKFFRALVEH
jgi:hypothetical protein